MICTQYLDKTAIFSGNDKISYRELYKEKNYSVTAMYSENGPEWMYAFFSGWKNKCTVVTKNVPIFPKLFAKISVEFLESVKPEGSTVDDIAAKVKSAIEDKLKI